jgi:hypothetical protein
MIRYIVIDSAGHILRSGHAPSEAAALEQGGTNLLVRFLDYDPGLIDDGKVIFDLTTGTLAPHPKP